MSTGGKRERERERRKRGREERETLTVVPTVCSAQGATPPSSLQGSTAAGLSRLLQEKEGTISALQASLLDKQKEEKEMGERITELSRYTYVYTTFY